MNNFIVKSHTSKSHILLPLIAGIVLGLFFLLFMNLDMRWCVLGVIGIIIPFLSILMGNPKKFFLAMLVLALPFNLDITIQHSGHIGGAAGFIISLFDIALVVLYVLWGFELIYKEDTKINFFPRISIPTLLLIGAAFLSMINAYSPQLCLFQIVEMLKMYLCFLYLANNIKNKNEVFYIIVFLMLGIFIESILAFFQHYYDRSFNLTILGGEEDLLRMKVDDGSMLARASGTVGSPNYFARYLNFILPLLVSISFLEKRRVYRVLYYLVLTAGIIALIFTFSRGAWTSFLISILVVVSLLSWSKRAKNISKIAFKLIAVSLIVAVVLFTFSGLIGSRLSSDDRGSAMSRLYLMQVALSIINAHPALGVGINNYTEVMHKYDTTTVSISSFAYQVHNIYLQIAAEMGIIALGIFIWLMYLFYREALGYIRLNNDILKGVVVGIIGGCTTFLLQGFIDVATLGNILYKILWFYMGLTLAIKNIPVGARTA